jgi:D-proline reductase (dithiol) PrdB
MGDLSEFSLSVRLFLKAYRWRRIDPVPWTPLPKPLSECRMALVSSAGFVAPGQEPFDDGFRGGDHSFREIPHDIDVATLINTHRSDSFDHRPVEQDPNLAFPLDRLRELAAEGRIGALSPRHLSFMGSITAPRRLVRDTAPAAVEALVADGVEAALLVPV